MKVMIETRQYHTKEHMGLTTWADAPDGKIKKSDVTIAKNYKTYSADNAGLGKKAEQFY